MHAGKFLQVERNRLREARKVGDAKDRLVGAVFPREIADVGKDLAVLGVQEAQRAAAEDLEELAQGDHVARPVQQRGLIAELGLDVDHLVAVDGVHDDREVEARGIAAREAGVAVGVPLHRRAYAVAVAEVDVVAHADLVAVVHDGRAGEAEEQ